MASVVVSIHLNLTVVPAETTTLAMAVSLMLVVGNHHHHHHRHPSPVRMEVGLPHQPSSLLLGGMYSYRTNILYCLPTTKFYGRKVCNQHICFYGQ